ncbi:glycosyltransferase family 4 protein [Cyclobacterium plantarum]|uniref:Glycosyltransferase family 4 protein n=1 Tax=Cyclobacterium plantarum TaxID=2716263 RepID=A0ABX0H786_9BACT|nr:glycosyltransferase family 4 protein [Cyclobacterium plantarum]NHE56238.1 glycosyltransferase family 4 protein [Cyclobacterium plantarum]
MERTNEERIKSSKIIRIVPLLDFGGVEQRIRLTVEGMNKVDQIHFDIIVLGAGGRISNELKVCVRNLWILDRDIRIPNLFLVFEIVRLLKKVKPDVVHTSGSEANFHGLIAAWIAKVPIKVGEEIGFPDHDWKWRRLFKLVYGLADRVIAISYSVKSRIVALGEVEETKVTVVNNPVELQETSSGKDKLSDVGQNIRSKIGSESFPRDGVSRNTKKSDQDRSNEFIFITVCRLVPIKNLDTLILVFSSLLGENQGFEPRLWIVGDGVDRARLESLCKDLSINEYVVFWGSQSGVGSFLKQADCFVLPSFSEGFSISLVEAMLSSLPCIVTNQGGPAEIVEDGVTGHLIDPQNSQDIKKKMLEVLLTSGRERAMMGERAKQSGSKYSVENYIKRLEEVYSLG